MRIAFAGTPEFALPALRALAASPHPLVGVLTQPDRPSGRGRRINPSPVKLAALALGLPLAQPQTLKTQEERTELESWRPDLLVVVAYGLILPPAALELPRLGCVNIHASLLPRWRGGAPVQRAILAGDTVTGVTIMQMDAGLDTGPILAQRSVPLDRTMTSGRLHALLATLGAEALLGTLVDLAAGAASPRAQPAEGVTYAAKIEKAEAPIDWRSSALEIERQVRAFDPRPAAETRLGEERLRILAAHALEGDAIAGAAIPNRPGAAHVDPAPAGTITAVGRDAIVVSCGEGRLAITKLQRAGGKPLSAGEFANAGRLALGQRLG